ncbi:CPBP family intramembrane glutamic endopeptidase [Rhodococcus coprophilus]|uniref:Hypothetical membrane protein n=1 Tax=Rhodococcus coprophilus TaxID=38310 RepID=A0A2X4TV40_9NOCA|nr:CPBP family intramembrane glutamic endopeptidase [Rhodococcus coprophilus]MBM7458173.1 membrane protease YdiL (CAAX protease family) [Rhodococcus coprophilus]SQI31257.1 hypothetical membrane protein [Rhodococcus coprophilus]
MTTGTWRGVVASAATLALGAALPAVRTGPRGRGMLSAAAGTGAVLLTRASGVDAAALGFDPARVRDGLRWGIGAATAVAAGYVVAVTVPGLRTHFVDEVRGNRADFYEWIGVHIPVGTVLAEELLFRSMLTALIGPVPQALVFGLWHVRPAMIEGDSVAGTVVVTGLSGLVFAWLRGRSGSVLAPALAHLAVNVGGAVAVRVATGRAAKGTHERRD